MALDPARRPSWRGRPIPEREIRQSTSMGAYGVRLQPAARQRACFIHAHAWRRGSCVIAGRQQDADIPNECLHRFVNRKLPYNAVPLSYKIYGIHEVYRAIFSLGVLRVGI
jgi:hypothetical protein